MTMTDRKVSARKGHPNALNEIKLLIFTISIAVVLGFWNIFSRQGAQVAQAAVQRVVLSSQPPQILVLDLPPLPTLVPPIESSTASKMAAQPATALVQPPVQQPAVKILMGGAKPRTAAASRPVTRTQSSR